jgi:hypothetical protein
VAVDPLLCEMVFFWLTSVPVVAVSLTSLLSYMLTPLPTSESVEFTMSTPDAPMRAVPERATAPVLFSVTLELLAAIEEFSSPAAVTLSIWLSRSGCLS